MNRVLLYQNAEPKLFDTVKNLGEAIIKVGDYYKKLKTSLEEVSKGYSLRIYFVEIIKNTDKEKEAKIISISPEGIPVDEEKAIKWTLNGEYKGTKIIIESFDKKDITYTIWETLEFLLGKENKNIIEDLDFKLQVRTKNGSGYSEKQKLILFFSKKGNWGRLWTYDEAREAMRKERLEMSGRGIEGERPREFRYDLGYPFITSVQILKVVLA